MKKIIINSLITVMSYSASVSAGAMGTIDQAACFKSFLAAEGGYTWNQVKGYNLNITGFDTQFVSQEKTSGGTGRLSAGLIRQVDELGLSSEIGFGYYGRVTSTPSLTVLGEALTLPNLNNKSTLTGLDVLVGVAYIDQDYGYSLYFKAGGLVENMSTNFDATLTTLDISESGNVTAALPEIKVGGTYDFDENWSLTASYLHAFGSSPRTHGTLDLTTLTTHLNANTQNPSISSVLVGIQYMI